MGTVLGHCMENPFSDNVNENEVVEGGSDRIAEMIFDAAGPELHADADEEAPNETAARFYNLVRDADEPLWDGCENHTRLSAVLQLMNIKSEFNMSVNCFDRLLVAIKSMLPKDEKLPESFYRAKKMVNELGLNYVKIDACPNHCMLYYKDNEDKASCDICGHSRFKPRRELLTKGKAVPFSTLRYFPVTQRLQRMFMSSKTAIHMTWHADRMHRDEDIISHPADGEAWKHFDRTHPTFSYEPRNVRVALCTDGFNPFAGAGAPYSVWPVFVTPYNLPPSMCMKQNNIFLSLVIPGPRNPGKNLDVYLRPLIDELKMLWNDGVVTYDASRKQNFTMKVGLLWTISDFPAYGMLSGWSTHGRLACPYCMDDTKAFRLQNSRKPCWFDCHRRFLPSNHPFRNQKDAFRRNTYERDEPAERLTGMQILSRLQELAQGPSSQQFPGFGHDHNWVKCSIFFELPYWSTLLIRHNLDVMHVEKNVFDNLFNTVMNIKGKTKDTARGREDLKVICKRPLLELMNISEIIMMPKATYVLEQRQTRDVYQWLKLLKFPDGYVSNISRCVKLDEQRIYGMKSHDCHVFMQRLVSLAFRDMLDKPIWGAISELSKFFRALCAFQVRSNDMLSLEDDIVVTICKLEKIFPPSFFDSMEHLLIHLPYEARVGGPVQFRWMYPYER